MEKQGNEILGIAISELENLGAIHTAREIAQQPELWMQVLKDFNREVPALQSFLQKASSEPGIQVILTGAGTSAFIGDTLEGTFQKNTGLPTKSVPTTDIVTYPQFCFSKKRKVILVSFARSGDSPESAQSIELAESLSKKVFHLIITCNRKSNLIDQMKGKDHFVLYMPDEANDKSLAMTSSFTSMLLGGILVSRINQLAGTAAEVNLISNYAEDIFRQRIRQIKQVAGIPFNRAVFLGSGPFGGVAREAHLKLQELTNGKTICIYDSFLGFRHGPKAVVNAETLMVYFFSNEDYVNKYEIDLVRGISQGQKPLFSLGIMETELDVELDMKIVLSKQGKQATEDFLPVVSVLPAQLLGFFKSLSFGLQPDSPSANGMIHRVVQGVNIYPYTKE